MTILTLNAIRGRRRLCGQIDPKALAYAWWRPQGLVDGTCIAAYQPKGAANLDRSYLNLVDSTIYKCVAGVAPTFSSSVGWSFTGTQYLQAFYSASNKPVSVVASITLSGTSGYRAIVGCNPKGGLELRATATSNVLWALKADIAGIGGSTGSVSANMRTSIGFSYDGSGNYVWYISGTASGSGAGNQILVDGIAIIGAYFNPTIVDYFLGSIHCLAAYNVVLTATQMSEIATAMAAI